MKPREDEKLKKLLLDRTGVDFQRVCRSSRKSLSIEVSAKDQIVLRVPYFVSKGAVFEFVNSKMGWIRNKQSEVALIADEISKLSFEEETRFLFLGKEYPLFYVKREFSVLMFDDAFFISANRAARAEMLFRKWYVLQAERIIGDAIRIWSDRMGLTFRSWRLTKATRSWGSCSSSRLLRINWRLIMAPEFVIYYVVVHELAHLKYMNHSSDYWQYVGVFVPKYKVAQQWLKKKGHLLSSW